MAQELPWARAEQRALFGEQNPHQPAGSFGSDVRRIPEDPLESAIAFFVANARTSGEERSELRRKAAFALRDAIVRWA